MSDAAEVLANTVREEWGRLLALLLARFRRLDLVEDALGDAVAIAADRWPTDGAPDKPAAWLLTTARRKVLDRIRHEGAADRTLPLLHTDLAQRQEGARTMADPGNLVEDDLLRLVLMCTHPALAPEASSALSLRLVLGVGTGDIARLFFVPEPTMAARITRAKKKIAAAGIPFAIPDASVLPERLDLVAQTAYLAFTAGYAPGSGADLIRTELAGEAIRLVRTVDGLRRDQPVLVALLALMLLQHSRRDARVGPDGDLVLLPDQDRTRWRHDEIDEGLGLLRSPALAGPVTVTAAGYAVQAAIAAEHAIAPTSEDTRWDVIVRQYDTLLRLRPSPAAALARAVAVAEADGPMAGLAALDGIDMPGSHRLPSVRAELARRAGDTGRAASAYAEAIALCGNETERTYLAEKLRTLAP